MNLYDYKESAVFLPILPCCFLGEPENVWFFSLCAFSAERVFGPGTTRLSVGALTNQTSCLHRTSHHSLCYFSLIRKNALQLFPNLELTEDDILRGNEPRLMRLLVNLLIHVGVGIMDVFLEADKEEEEMQKATMVMGPRFQSSNAGEGCGAKFAGCFASRFYEELVAIDVGKGFTAQPICGIRRISFRRPIITSPQMEPHTTPLLFEWYSTPSRPTLLNRRLVQPPQGR